MADRFDVVVIGGGPAGSVAGRCISAAGYSVGLLEKRPFPRETLCGEFLSREVVGTISHLGLEPSFQALHPNPLTRFTLLPGKGGPLSSALGFTAYGLKRGKLDALLLDAAKAGGVEVFQPAEVTDVERNREGFLVRFRDGKRTATLLSSWVVGAYGRSSPLDRLLHRSFAGIRTGYTGVKFHVPAELLENISQDEILIALGPGAYCGVSHVGDGTATICYLERHGTGTARPRERLRELALQNPDFAGVVTPRVLSSIVKAPVYGAGNIFFGTRAAVENGVLMVGDAAGVIAPLAGDGIGIAMEQARLLGDLFATMQPGTGERDLLAERYRTESSKLLTSRKRAALLFQSMALASMLRLVVSPLLTSAPGLLRAAIHATRGSATKPN